MKSISKTVMKLIIVTEQKTAFTRGRKKNDFWVFQAQKNTVKTEF